MDWGWVALLSKVHLCITYITLCSDLSLHPSISHCKCLHSRMVWHLFCWHPVMGTRTWWMFWLNSMAVPWVMRRWVLFIDMWVGNHLLYRSLVLSSAAMWLSECWTSLSCGYHGFAKCHFAVLVLFWLWVWWKQQGVAAAARSRASKGAWKLSFHIKRT